MSVELKLAQILICKLIAEKLVFPTVYTLKGAKCFLLTVVIVMEEVSLSDPAQAVDA